MTKQESVARIIRETWNETDIVDAWNEMLKSGNREKEQIYSMDYFTQWVRDWLNEGNDARYLADMINEGYINSEYDWFWLEGNALRGCEYIDDYGCPIDENLLAGWIVENGDSSTYEVDNEELIEDFFDEYFAGDDDAMEIVEDMKETDFLMEDWNDIASEVKIRLARTDREEEE